MESTMQPTPLLISRILEFGAQQHADAEAVTWTADGPRRTSYRQIGEDAARLAHALRGLGIEGDRRVATFMWNNAEHLTAYLAVPSMGAVLHALNIRLPPEQIIYITGHAGNEVVVVDNTLAGPFSQLLPHLTTLRHVIVNGPVSDEVREALAAPAHIEGVHDWTALLADQPDTFDWPELDEHSASSMCYTSGTTGHPKGVAYSHRSNYLHTMEARNAFNFQEGDRMLAVVPLFHANAWGLPYAALMGGSSLILPDRFLQAEPLARMIESEKVTLGAAVPTIWSDLLRYLDTHEVDTSTLRRVTIGGSACPRSLMEGMEQRHQIEVVHAWGMTETSPLGSVAIPPAGLEGEELWRYKTSQGRLPAGVEGRLMGPDGNEQPWDGKSVGELEVRGPWIAASYYANGQESDAERAEMASRFHDGWLRTGDVGTLTPDGFLTLTDRAKDVIKSGGEWISSVALENALMAHPEVLEASVVGVPDDRWGERPLATVVRAEGSTVDAEVLRSYLEGKVAHWQVPERWAFIDEVPKTSVGKFDKKVLRRRYADGELAVELA
ncbi:MAG TPA: long-chain fatty acid--CoA ligase [Segeticoccus sp.]|uniref:long-chain fatty acid--CoA ligase n=1 Tax=Segeticoccus sp. TaxID=2706531 RepID=UPI002D80811F|nr:long-chain fatty acid--CoA ligase [Segeticoccus sp.]HET8601499.1 long-chain fatty acid--CoA ligase [Segeticoccus sp.]